MLILVVNSIDVFVVSVAPVFGAGVVLASSTAVAIAVAVVVVSYPCGLCCFLYCCGFC